MPPAKRQRQRSCNVCQDLEPILPSSGYSKFSDVKISAWNGCHGCRALENIMPTYWQAFHLNENCLWTYCTREDSLVIQTSFILPRMPLPIPAGTLQLWTLTPSTCPWRLEMPDDPAHAETRKHKVITCLQDWMHQCDETHEGCRSIQQLSILPTRVVEILSRDHVRLKETAGEKAPYVCLSHCWGTDKFIQTTADTISKHIEAITWTELPKTFRDAINITFDLGFRFIWIDSLCIIQGDTDDWLREGGKMSEIYSNAQLTIAATRSRGPAEGCYAPLGSSLESFHTFANASGEKYEIYVRGEAQLVFPFDTKSKVLPHINDFEHGDEAEFCFPLVQRAWAFQERFLSPRMVHFGPRELLWECRQLKTCECSEWPGYGAPNQGLFFEAPSMKSDNTPATFDGHTITTPTDWKWRRVVEQYSSRTLRFENDIFPALQGVAKSMQKGRGYLAGLWDDTHLLSNLLWQTRDPSSRRNLSSVKYSKTRKPYNPPARIKQGPRPHTWRAPSWSWASVTKPVIFDVQCSESYEKLASIISIQMEPLRADPLSQLQSGRLYLKGRCAMARMSTRYVNDRCQQNRTGGPIDLLIGVRYMAYNSDLVQIWDMSSGPKQLNISDYPYIRSLSREWQIHNMAELERMEDNRHELRDRAFVKTFYPDFDIPLDGRTVYLMEILRWYKREAADGPSKEMYSYLAFDCVDVDRGKGVYERIGCFHTEERLDDTHFFRAGEEMTLHIA